MQCVCFGVRRKKYDIVEKCTIILYCTHTYCAEMRILRLGLMIIVPGAMYISIIEGTMSPPPVQSKLKNYIKKCCAPNFY